MKTRYCPCCNEVITFNAFLKALFTFKKGNFAENEVGLLCPHCRKSIVSAERKNQFFIPVLGFALLPILLLGIAWEVLLSSEQSIYFLSYSLFTLAVVVLVMLKVYKNVSFICSDVSSDKYNKEMTYV